ncbi:MAG: NnrU family protein [Proteobacteria bacterium]|nr:NnrU family protein [Pseudomonadota bacterium]
MHELIAGLLLFLGMHSLRILAPGVRARAVARLGLWPWKGLYALVSIAGLALIVHGFAVARYAAPVLYVPPPALRALAVAILAPALPMLLSAYLPGRLSAWLHHPMLAATRLWAFAHLLANGRLADVLLFGGILVWAIADRLSVGRRPREPVPALPAGRYNDAIAVVAGLALYAALIAALHQRLFGVSPLG